MSDPNAGGGAPPPRVAPVARTGAVRLTHVAGGQYVLNANVQSQPVPPLSQISNVGSSSGNTNVTTIVSRIQNLTPSRPTSGGASLSSLTTSTPKTASNASSAHPTILNVLAKPRQTPPSMIVPGAGLLPSGLRSQQQTPTSMFAAPSSQVASSTPGGVTAASPTTSTLVTSNSNLAGIKKRIKLNDGTTEPTVNDESVGLRRRILEHKVLKLESIKESYSDHMMELYYLQMGGDLSDFATWRKKPPTVAYQQFCSVNKLEKDDDSGSGVDSKDSFSSASVSATTTPQRAEIKMTGVGLTPVAVSTTLPAAVAQLTQQGQIPGRPQGGRHGMVFAIRASTPNPAPALVPGGTPLVPENASGTPVVPSRGLSHSTINSTDKRIGNARLSTTTPPVVNRNRTVNHTSSGNQEQIVEKAKQEAYVMQRINELQREGLWSDKRLPRLQEPPRTKVHWDYLLEEMVWLSTDFAQERKWKKAAAKRCARMVQKYFQDKAVAAQKAEKAQELQLRRIAAFLAREVRNFWANIQKVVEFKQQTRLEEKRKQALDQHLSFIVDQTEKYSQLLAEGMNKSGVVAEGNTGSANSSRQPSPSRLGSDAEFNPGNQSSSDDEETIAQAEAESSDEAQELAALQRESELDLDTLISADYLQNRDKIVLSSSSDSDSDNESDKESKGDIEFTMESDKEESDVEDTILEQEKAEGAQDHKKELDELKELGEMDIDELRKKFANLPSPEASPADGESNNSDEEGGDDEISVADKSDVSDDESSVDEESPSESENSNADNDVEDVGLKSLLDDSTKDGDKTENKDHLFNDVAALAESIQPKGNTLSSTSVVTPIPFLLKHTLREYQHIGLDWLVTMFERKLNGILADEMGLGKTIQTIALLAHLACVKGDWGPHLIIVPTSVMLNWEMEFKKWCPGFKILTYYGSQKERKLKRIGWTKPNAFHICITSYKLVIQDHQSFRRKKWKYLILDEAQNIKNFKSQRWQLLLNFQTQQRLLLTGTPLQNNLMELWSLMHFLMPNVFQSHKEFKEWFSNPVTGMIEGNSEYNESIIKRLHKVLRPFLLRRLKCEVEKQMPKKYEHIVLCRLSKRQRYLYDDFMSRAKTRETLAAGNLLSVINVLMQLRKVCNHPNLFEVRPTVSPFQMEGITFTTASLVYGLLDFDPINQIDLYYCHFLLAKLETNLRAVDAHRIRQLALPKKMIEEIDHMPEPPPPCPKGKIHLRVKLSEPRDSKANITNSKTVNVKSTVATTLSQQGLKIRMTGATQNRQGYLQIVPHTNVKTISLNSAVPIKPGTEGMAPLAQIVQPGKHYFIANCTTPTQLQTSTGQRVTVLTKSPFVTSTVAAGSRIINTTTKAPTMLIPAVTTVGNIVTQTGNAETNIATQPNHLPSSTTETKPTNTSNVTLSQPLNVSLVNQLLSQFSSAQSTPTAKVSSKSESPRSSFYDPVIEKRKRKVREMKLSILARVNSDRCSAFPLYGEDLRNACNCFTPSKNVFDDHPAYRDTTPWTARGYAQCRDATFNNNTSFSWHRTKYLKQAIRSVEDYIVDMKDILDRFVFCVPAVQAPVPKLHVSHPPPGKLWAERRMELIFQQELSKPCAPLHTITRNMATQFPDPRLIQFDCGKLQTLDKLLRKLKTEGHRVLIFTQMTRMLDVLESFLNYHGHIYLRLDGTTKVDQRQVLMERFNGDKRIFVFILSTRSGGVGVNLTGADTVIFYDSDWNPTMDAQAQDRCHRIGQTRDVHIYRLVSERTIEENILKKANQKRMLGDLAIEGGNFTTAYFKSSTIQDLFEIDNNEDAHARMAEVTERDKERKEKLQQKQLEAQPSSPSGEERSAMGVLENALATCEDEQDVQAARTAKAEAVAELAEFDESIPLEEDRPSNEAGVSNETPVPVEPELSRAEQEVQNLVKQLSPIELYALRFVEDNDAVWSAQQLAAAEAEIEAQKLEWEANRLKALQEEEETRKQRMREEDDILTFSREDAINQVWISDNGNEEMPMWCPPTPPQDDNDVYIDHTVAFLYETEIMTEAQLPPVYVKREPKRSRHEAGLPDSRRPLKTHRKEESVFAPRSLFDRPSPAVLKMRREFKQHKYRNLIRPSIPVSGLKISNTSKGAPEPENVLEWLIDEDMALLKAIQIYQRLPLNLMVASPAHSANWDLVADYVNNISRIYRSPKQCKNRYDIVIVPREEGKLLFEPASKKQKKTKNIYKAPQQTKGNRSMRTAQIYTQDNYQSFFQLLKQRFDMIKTISNKRVSTVKPTVGGPVVKSTKHVTILGHSGINYEQPPNPMEVAARRVERLSKEKKIAVLAPQSVAKAPQSSTAPPATPAPQTAAVAATQASATSTSQSVTQIAIAVSVSQPTTHSSASVATALRNQRISTGLVQGTNVVTVGGITAGQIQGQRLIVAGQTVSGAKGLVTGTVSTAGGKVVNHAQLQLYRQQLFKQQQLRQLPNPAVIQHQLQQNTSTAAIGAGATIVKTSIAGSTAVSNPTQTVSIQQTQMTPTQKAYFLKQATPGSVGKQALTRTIANESEVAALIKRQQQIQSQKQHVHTQIFTQTGQLVQQAGTSQVATLVKAVATPGSSTVTIPVSGVTLGPGGQVKTATAQQLRQLQLHSHIVPQRKLPTNTKVAQLTQVSANKTLLVQTPKMTLHQVMRVQNANTAQLASATGSGNTQHVVLAKAGVARATSSVLPGQAHGLKQTIQVVTANSTTQQALQASGIRPQVSGQSALAGALTAGTIKVASPAQQASLLSQVTAALQGQQISMAVRQGGSPVRIQATGTPMVAVSMQSAVTANTSQIQTTQQIVNQPATSQGSSEGQQSQQQQISYRVLKK